MILLVVVRLVPVGNALLLKLPPALAVDVLHCTGLRKRVILL